MNVYRSLYAALPVLAQNAAVTVAGYYRYRTRFSPRFLNDFFRFVRFAGVGTLASTVSSLAMFYLLPSAS